MAVNARFHRTRGSFAPDLLLPMGGASARPGVTAARRRHRGGDSFGDRVRPRGAPGAIGLGLPFPAHEV